MAWMRLEVSYIDHPKFLALSDGAFRLWHEGKSYCEKHLTDGLISDAAVKGFRHFNTHRAKELGTVIHGYLSPLWEPHVVGFKMHDYLDHNDCRDVAQQRISAAHAEKERKRENIKAFRDRKKLEAVTGYKPVTAPVTDTAPVTALLPHRTEKRNEEPASSPTPSPDPDLKSDREKSRRSSGQPPLALGLRRFKVWRWMLDECIAALGEHADAFDIEAFLQALDAKETRVIPDVWPWLKTEMLAEARRRGLATVETSDRKPLFTQTSREMGEAVLANLQRDPGLPR